MPLDPNIILQAGNFKTPDYATTLAQVANIKASGQEAKLRDLQITGVQRDNDTRVLLSKAFDPATGEVDPVKAKAAFMASGDVAGARKFETDRLTAVKAQIDNAMQIHGTISQILGGVTDQASLDAARAELGKNPATAQGAAQLPQQYDEAGAATIHNLVVQGQTVGEQLTAKKNAADAARQKLVDGEAIRHNKASEGTAAAEAKRGTDTLAETIRHNKAAEEAANPFGSVVAPPGAVSPTGQVAPARPTGDEFLKTLPPQLQGQVKMLAEGKLAIPSGQALRTPYWQQLLQAANQYDPSIDQASAPARFKTRAAFSAGGTESKTINNLNTAIGHAGTLLDQISGTFSGPITSLNGVANFISEQTGRPGVPLFKDTAGKLAQELTAVYRGSGGAEADVVRGLKSLSENASDEQKRAVLSNAVELLSSKMDALGDQYNRGMGTTKDPLELLNSHAQATFKKLRGGGETAPAQGAAETKTLNGVTYHKVNGQWMQ